MMGVQFGRWNFEGQAPAPDYIEKVSATLAPYGPDSNESYLKDGVKILYRAFYTTTESRRETQPHLSQSGAVITWDGRLDNRAELIRDVQGVLALDSTDVAIVAAAYEKWGGDCFARLIGDWALSIWDPINRLLLLAKDPIGTRHLFYSFDKDQVTWCTILDPLVRFAGKTFALNEEYIAGWFSYFPAAHLTPYVGIQAVPPSSFVLLRPARHTVSKYWDFDPAKEIRYGTDTEYEEHFRIVFAKAVQRRLRSDRPILADLSGGMDSSSIVCMADIIIARGEAETPRLDTISWFDSSRATWDDPLYFTKVEEKRGRIGCHIDLSSPRDGGSQAAKFDSDCFAATPIPSNLHAEFLRQYAECMMSQGNRVTLSGIAGESATGGGLPTPTPELQNLLARARFLTLARQLNAWAAKVDKSRFSLLWEAAREFLPLALARKLPEYISPAAPWFLPGFVRRNHAALCGYQSRVKLFGPLPSFQRNVRALDVERKLVAEWPLQPKVLREVRFPYLDRDLREFMYAIPQGQTVGVGRRRFLMRRALVGVVPDELLNRKPKAFFPQEPPKSISTEWANLVEAGQNIVSGSLGIINPNRFWEALQKALHKERVSIGSVRRTLTLESWLGHLMVHNVLSTSEITPRLDYSSLVETEQLQTSTQAKSSAS